MKLIEKLKEFYKKPPTIHHLDSTISILLHFALLDIFPSIIHPPYFLVHFKVADMGAGHTYTLLP